MELCKIPKKTPQAKIPMGNSENSETEFLPVFSIFKNSNPQNPNMKVAPNYLEHTLVKFEIKQKPFDTF